MKLKPLDKEKDAGKLLKPAHPHKGGKKVSAGRNKKTGLEPKKQGTGEGRK